MNYKTRRVVQAAGALAWVGSVFFGLPSVVGYRMTRGTLEAGYSEGEIRRRISEGYGEGMDTKLVVIRAWPGIEAALLLHGE
ncbi:MAG: hypothetical protein HYW25_00680 [Candidatus Aenigmarchaeota archaeon]|nr:hypothetical protein [Candidatus Aenigmarchaeota archaeon]